MRTRWLVAAMAVAASLVWPNLGATAFTPMDQVQDIVDEMSCIQPNEFSACYHGAAQTVTVGMTGRLEGVDLILNRESITTKDLIIEIRANSPSGALLATSDPVPAVEIPLAPASDWVPFYFATPPLVHAGDVIAIVIPVLPLQPTSDPIWRWGKADVDWYPDGVAWGPSTDWGAYVDGSDFAFTTWITPPLARLSGPDRFATAVAISENNFPLDVPVVYVATGANFPDALAGAAAAGHAGAPLLLVPGSGSALPPAVVDELGLLNPETIVVLGGTGAVNATNFALLQALAPSVVRLAGSDRYLTAIEISKATYPAPPVGTVFIATGRAFPDALAAAAVAGRDDAPLLLVNGQATTLGSAVRTELLRLSPTSVVIAGGSGAVSGAIEAELKTMFGSGNVVRQSGATRYETAAALSAANFAGGGVPVAYVATGLNFPDALAGAALAGRDGAPLLLVPGNQGSIATAPAVGAELSRLIPGQIVVFGGSGAVSNGIYGQLGTYVVP
ncbi:MAG TPA: cell wall-binding repeat-containing protein [Candidatus Limnocylindrales bacterium]|nr:cell wall-binding repeat-containing protein [Candidatus Limnocylindrales bacterium]